MTLSANLSPPVQSETSDDLLRRAERVRQITYQVTREDDRRRLEEYAAELEARAAKGDTRA